MDAVCKFCGKSGLRWDLNKDGDNALFTTSETEHVCKRKNTTRERYFEMLERQTMVEEYLLETGGQMHALNVAACYDREER